MFRKGIVTRKDALVNWDPVDATVLANEQIDDNGRSWRSGSKVEKKLLKQWFIKSSAYAKSLLDSMNDLNTDDWHIVKNIQRMWIGNINGCFIDFKLKVKFLKLRNNYDLNFNSHFLLLFLFSLTIHQIQTSHYLQYLYLRKPHMQLTAFLIYQYQSIMLC
jgi:leucyl-tRNA synthetase